MNRYFYIDDEGKQKGTFAPHELKQENVNRNTLVWTQGMEQWKRAEEVEELQFIFSGFNSVSDAIQPPPVATQPTPETDDIPPVKPDNWLIPSILATIFCCIVFGIVGVVFAARVDSLYYKGMYAEAEQAAKKAKIWTLLAVGFGLLYLIASVLWILPNVSEILEKGVSGYNF